jgi:hypothetical protein
VLMAFRSWRLPPPLLNMSQSIHNRLVDRVLPVGPPVKIAFEKSYFDILTLHPSIEDEAKLMRHL